MTAEAQHVVDVSLKKIVAWQKKQNDLHRSLLLASVLLKAHSACSASAPAILNDDDHHMSSSSSSSSSSSPTTTMTDDVERDDDDDVIVTLDDASIIVTCPRNPEVRDFDQEEESWDAIPDQALDEWTLSTNSERTDAERNATTTKTDSEIATDKHRDRGGDNASAHSSLSTRKRRLEVNDTDSEVASKRQRRRTDCETLCLDFDDLITSMEDEFSVSAIDHLGSSKGFDDSSPESFELEQSTGGSCENYFETLDCSAVKLTFF